jgi:hypothetical protein
VDLAALLAAFFLGLLVSAAVSRIVAARDRTRRR